MKKLLVRILEIALGVGMFLGPPISVGAFILTATLISITAFAIFKENNRLLEAVSPGTEVKEGKRIQATKGLLAFAAILLACGAYEAVAG